MTHSFLLFSAQGKYFKSVSKVPPKQIIAEVLLWCHGVMVINTAQLHSIKPELKKTPFVNQPYQSTIPQNNSSLFIIIITIIFLNTI